MICECLRGKCLSTIAAWGMLVVVLTSAAVLGDGQSVGAPWCWDCTTQCHGDTDCDDDVDTSDWPMFRDSFGYSYPSPQYHPCGDMDHDGDVDTDDWPDFRDNFGKSYVPTDCPLGGTWPPTLPYQPQPHLSQFGYYAVSIDPYDDYIQDVCGRTNFNHVDWSVQRAIDTAACDAKMVLNLRWYLFDVQNELRPDYLEVWAWLSAQIAPYIDTVGAFYVMDEPYSNGMSQSTLETAAALIKATFPHTPTMVAEGWPAVTSSLQMPAHIDYYGFDQYGDFTAIPALLEIVKSKLLPGQQVFLVPQNISNLNNTDAQVASWAYDYYHLALAEESIVALMVFLWPDLTDEGYPGLVLAGPDTLAAFDDIGQQIISGAKPEIFFPSSYTINQGEWPSGDVASLRNYDNDYLVVYSTSSGTTRYVTTDFDVTGISIAAPSQIKVRIITQVSASGITQAIQFWNYATSAWDTQAGIKLVASVVTQDFSVTTGASDYLSGGNMKVRVIWSRNGPFNISHEQIAVLTYE